MIGKPERLRIKIWLAELLAGRRKEVETPNGEPSLTKIIELVKIELGMVVTRQTIATYLKEDLAKYLDKASVAESKEMQEYDTMMLSAKQIWNNLEHKPVERTKAYNSWLKAKKQREDLERKLQAELIRQAEVKKPNFLLKFVPGHALRKCPACGHEFYDNVEKVEKEKVKTEEEE